MRFGVRRTSSTPPWTMAQSAKRQRKRGETNNAPQGKGKEPHFETGS